MVIMLETPHVALGTAIAMKVGNPYLALPLAFASHFLLDKVPHWNPHTYTEAVNKGKLQNDTVRFALSDIALSAILGVGLASTALPDYTTALIILAGGFLGVMPDVVKYPFFLVKSTRKGLYKKYVDFERSLQVEVGFRMGMFVQLIVTLASIWWFFA